MGKNKTDITASAEKKPIWKQRRLAMLLSPLAVALAVFAIFKKFSLYPFGSRTAAWCDMNQQVVPLLCQFKDILDGRSGMFLSFKNASGMNFWGVFFFFLASPFSLLVKFVQKSDMLVFMNILIVLKMAASAFTSSLYFVRSSFMKKLDTPAIVILSFLSATSVYVLLFYQNVIWLDMMYLFPLLLLSLEKLRGGSPVWYILVMALMMAVNYYIGYLVVVILLLPSTAPLIGCLMLGNLFRECGCTDRLSDPVQNALMNIVTIFLSTSVGATMVASNFLKPETLKIIFLGLVAFGISTAGGLIGGNIMCKLSGKKVNQLIGSAGVNDVPMAARVSQQVGQETNPSNFLLMHAMGPNVAGVIGSAVAAGVLLAVFG